MDINATSPLTQWFADYYGFFAGRLSAGLAAGLIGGFILAFHLLRRRNPSLDLEERRANQPYLAAWIGAGWTFAQAAVALAAVTGAVISAGVAAGWFPHMFTG